MQSRLVHRADAIDNLSAKGSPCIVPGTRIYRGSVEVGDQVVVVVSMRSGQRYIKRCKTASTAAGTSTILAK